MVFMPQLRRDIKRQFFYLFILGLLRASGGCVLLNISQVTRLHERGYVTGGGVVNRRMEEATADGELQVNFG